MQFKGLKRSGIAIIILVITVFFTIKYFIAPHPIQYQTIKVTTQDLQKKVLATGKLDAVRKLDVGAQVSGQLKHLYVKLGDKVTQGQLLAVIDAQQAESRIREVNAILQDLNAQLRQGLAERRLTKLTLDRQHTLAKLHVISQHELDKASTDLEIKNARLETIKAQIDKTIASLESAKINLGYTKITAPMGGEVVQITTLEGQTVIAAQKVPTILTLADMQTMLVNAQVSEADVIHLTPGLKASFTILGDQSKHFHGVLKDILLMPEKINDAVFYLARFEVPNPDALLRLQMTAQISIELSNIKQAMVVPLAALKQKLADNLYQVVVLKNGKEEKREVAIGIRNNINAQILSGLMLGEEVIIGRSHQEKTL
ncbi:macrolide transporter subunit MacA [Candidatus Regiella endosymbiont of Tuberolachnus salignus]|uniref:macrolide transporter subunit MacA n=1 Tax=Candidatus Regiella endosymbiont of Tuberolachnus salignus TaxID=3077956 RepID=UPI003BAF072B